MQLSVIILNYNVRYFLELCVQSVLNALQDIESEIIVIDNASIDDSCEMMKTQFPDVKLIENKTNFGFPKGNNIGVATAKGEYVCILNPDTIVAEDTFKKAIAFAKKQSNLGIVGCKLIDGTGRFLPESKRGVPTPWVAFTKIVGMHTWFSAKSMFSKYTNRYYAGDILENETGKVAILVGAFMLMKRELYQKMGGFDEKCFMYADDIDLSYRALKLGLDNYYFHDTTVIHYKGESTIKNGVYMKRFQEAMSFFYKKHFKSPLFFSFFLKIGVYYFSIFKKNQTGIQQYNTSKSTDKKFILFSENENLFQKIDQLYTKGGQMLQTNSIDNLELNKAAYLDKTEVIFDHNYLNYKTIIQLFEIYKSTQNTFKIISKNASFLIGSNSSFDRGEIILF